MPEASMFKEVQDMSLLFDFLKQSSDQTVLQDLTFCKSSKDNSFISDKTYVSSNDTFRTCFTNSDNSKGSNDTYIAHTSPAGTANSTKVISPTITKIISPSNGVLNSTKTLSPFGKDNVLSRTQTLSDNKTDVTFDLNSKSNLPNDRLLDAPYQTSDFHVNQERHSAVSNNYFIYLLYKNSLIDEFYKEYVFI